MKPCLLLTCLTQDKHVRHLIIMNNEIFSFPLNMMRAGMINCELTLPGLRAKTKFNNAYLVAFDFYTNEL